MANRGKPRQVFLRRAYSSLYYAMFHALANSCADMLIGRRGKASSKHAWVQIYRAVDHGYAKAQCTNAKILSKFPPDIANFGSVFVNAQIKRHEADYNPYIRFYKSAILNDRTIVQDAITRFLACDPKDTRAFASWVIIGSRAA